MFLPKVLISNEGTRTYLTYTTKRQDFDLQAFKTLVAHFEQTTMDNPEEALGDVTRMEDIYKDDWRDLVKKRLIRLTTIKNRSRTSSFSQI